MRTDLAYCDFLVLAPLDLEINAIEASLSNEGWNISEIDTQTHTYYPRLLEVHKKDKKVSRYERRGIIIQLNAQGVLNAGVDTAKALEIYEAGYVISFGIAGTFSSDDAPIGTVVYATHLFYYEPSKDKSNRTRSRTDPIPVGDTLLNTFRKIKFENTLTRVGPLASGEKLFADIKSNDRARILEISDKILGVEMEAAGVGRAVQKLCKSEFIALKGISDESDGKKK